MSALPPGIFFVNGDISLPPTTSFTGETFATVGSSVGPSTLTNLTTQLFINEWMYKSEFDARVESDPDYPLIVHLQGLRILVVVPSYHDKHNREYADAVMFFHQGMVDVEKNYFGPEGKCYDAQRVNMYEILRAAKDGCHDGVAELPWFAGPRCDSCYYPFFCDRCHTFSGMKKCNACGCDCGCGCGTSLIDNQGIKVGIIYAPNCDNEYHNPDFIRRK